MSLILTIADLCICFVCFQAFGLHNFSIFCCYYWNQEMWFLFQVPDVYEEMIHSRVTPDRKARAMLRSALKYMKQTLKHRWYDRLVHSQIYICSTSYVYRVRVITIKVRSQPKHDIAFHMRIFFFFLKTSFPVSASPKVLMNQQPHWMFFLWSNDYAGTIDLQ